MDIDLVYLWVAGSDPVWRAKKAACEKDDLLKLPEATGECRFLDNGELRYSLRSVEKFAPWIRRIFIVTDNQIPSWLNTSDPRVSVVDHREIMPHEVLPVFNSNALELYLHRIPDLSEHFLYANDDMFFGAPVTPDFFFDSRGLPIVRLKHKSVKRHLDQVYPYKVYRAQQEILRRFGRNYTLSPHHNIDAYCKSDFAACVEEFREQVERSAHSRFRCREDLQRSVILYYALAKGRATMRRVSSLGSMRPFGAWIRALFGAPRKVESRYIPMEGGQVERMYRHYSPALFCLNDNERVTPEERNLSRDFLERLFPERSRFELPEA